MILISLSATGHVPLTLVQTILLPYLSVLAWLLLRLTLALTATLAFLHQTGALRRYAINFAEVEISKNINGAPVTLSDGQFDIWRGKVIARDLIIHNKDIHSWEWDSPCLARIGRIDATLNLTSVIKLPFGIGHVLDHEFFDIYTALVEDVQVFVEKRKNVFNFHLLDPSLNIPDHTVIMEAYKQQQAVARTTTRQRLSEIIDPTTTKTTTTAATTNIIYDGENINNTHNLSTTTTTTGVSKSGSVDEDETRGDTNIMYSNRDDDDRSLTRETEDEANKIVESLVGAVSKIGRAANEGGSRALQTVLRNQKDGLVQNLKQLRTQKSMSTTGGGGGDASYLDNSKKVVDWESTKKHGVSVMRELGKVVEKNVSDIKTSLAFLQQPPQKKADWKSKSPDYIRVGSILLREGRIFTKDILLSKPNNNNNNNEGHNDDAVNVPPSSSLAHHYSASNQATSTLYAKSKKTACSGWTRPIVISELAITSAELCPPMSVRDLSSNSPTFGMPMVGITIDRLLDIGLQRVMAEVAKSETGRVFQAAFGDVSLVQ